MRNLSIFIDEILAEDLGPTGRDLSVLALGDAAQAKATATVKLKQAGVVCGLGLIEPVIVAVEERRRALAGWAQSTTPYPPEHTGGSLFRSPRSEHESRSVPATRIELVATDGQWLDAGAVIARLTGPVGTLLTAERTLLNLVQRLSGIATLTRRFVDAVADTKAKILDTRKTTPGLRALEKLAVRVGGGVNHRTGLYDMIMLKDNHLTAMGDDIAAAVAQARAGAGPAVRIEVEAATLDQVERALAAGADMIMLDNMSIEEMKACVTLVAGRVPLEASGGITLESVGPIAGTGVDFISVGALTHSAPSLDISMKIAANR